jgi:hypothetical protein
MHTLKSFGLVFVRIFAHCDSVADELPIEMCRKCLIEEATKKTLSEECVPVPFFGNLASPDIEVATIGLSLFFEYQNFTGSMYYKLGIFNLQVFKPSTNRP